MAATRNSRTGNSRPPTRRRSAEAGRTHLVGDDLEWTPLQLSSEEVPETTRMPLFYLDDKQYDITMPFPVNLSLQYLRMARTEGENIATGWLMEQVLGVETFEALMNYKGLKASHLKKIGHLVSNLALGAVEDPKDNSEGDTLR